MTQSVTLAPPLVSAVSSARAALAGVAAAQPAYLRVAEKAGLLRELAALSAQVAELQARVLAVADDVAEESAHRDAGAWLAEATTMDAPTAHGAMRFAQALAGWETVAAGMARGAVSEPQARAVVGVLEQLPAELGVDQIGRAEAWLVEQCARLRPAELRRVGRHLLEVVAPEIAEEAEARRLLAEEADAATRASLSLRQLGDGTTRVSGLVPDAVGARLRTVLEAWAQPRKAALVADGRRAPYGRLMSEALGHLLESLDPDRLPLHGGDATTVIVTMPLEGLRAELATATVDGASACDLSAAQARRLACQARIIPEVLGGRGEILDLGRAQRLFSSPQRKALRLRDGGCRAEGCSVPASWCDAHHVDPWSRGGSTDLANAMLLCGHHHRRAHDPDFDHTRLPDGSLRFHRRT